MTRDELYDLVMGAAVVTIAYMLWKQHKGQGQASQGAPIPNIPAPPEIMGNDETGYWYDLDRLMQGAI